MRQFKLVAAIAAVALVACGPQKVDPTLAILPAPRTIDGDGSTTTVRVVTTDNVGAPGTGTVHITSAAGSLVDGADVTLADGEGKIDFSCDRAVDATCTGQVKLTAKWNDLSISTNVTVRPAAVPDAGVSLTATPASLSVNLGQHSDLVATYVVDGTATAGMMINLTSTLGTVLLPDAGAWQPTATDSAGQVHAVLIDTGVPGTATVTATATDGKTATTAVTMTMPDAGIKLSSDTQVLTIGFNQSAAITLEHEVEGTPLPGHPIKLTATLGTLLETDGGAFVSPALTDASGRIYAMFKDNGNVGTAVITATDDAFKKTQTLTIGIAPPDAGVGVSLSKNTVYTDIGDSTVITATLYSNGTPAPNQPLDVAVSTGSLTYPDNTPFAGSGTTDAQGRLVLKYLPGTTTGTTTVTVTDPSSNRTAVGAIAVRTIQNVTFVSMSCPDTPTTGTNVCIMGITGSGFNTTATLTFKVTDNQSQPVPDLPVTFSTASTGIINVPASGVTNSSGEVTVQITSTVNTGTFNVVATGAAQSAPSPTIAVRGAKPTSTGILLSCGNVNLPAYISPSFPRDVTSTCTVSLTDRRNNPIGTGKVVEFSSETGSITQSIATQAYVPGGNNTSEGKATVTFNSSGNSGLPAQDVDPLGAVATQYPAARLAEPSRAIGLVTGNPRDGLVTIIAFTDGEEAYTDTNLNGVYDLGEPFVDIGEPCVDKDDDDVCNNFDTRIGNADLNNNGVWDGPNGVWDGATKVWTKAYVLYTGAAAVGSTNPATSAASPTLIAGGTSMSFDFFASDQFLNRMASGTTLPMVNVVGGRGTATWNPISSGALNDAYGFGVSYQLLNVAGDGPCTSTTNSICTYHTRFTSWWNGYVGTLTVTAPVGGTAENRQISVRPTTLTDSLDISVFLNVGI